MFWRMLSGAGFRPFFLLAGLFGVASMAVWSLLHSLHMPIPVHAVSPMAWHAHEMIFGYAGAVIAGFLLTSVRNWTGLPTLSGAPLWLLVLLWLAPRLLALTPSAPLALLALFDLSFQALLILALGIPLARTRQWKNLAVLSHVLLLMLSNLLYYLGLLSLYQPGVNQGIQAGFYLVVGLVLLMCRRLIPLFTSRGLGQPLTLRNSGVLDHTALALFLLFWGMELARPGHPVGALLAAALAMSHGIRWCWWHRPGIWQRPLLWVLFVGYGFLILGFAMRALAWLVPLSPFLVLHAFAVGGVGLITMGMMARVSLGHTGQDVHHPPPRSALMFALLILAALARVLMPILDPARQGLWIGASQLLWVLSFGLFGLVIGPMLLRPRLDGSPG